MADRRLTLVLLSLTAVVFLLAAPAALRDALEHGEFYVFTTRFLADIPKRLAGPGRFRFVLQPTMATLLGIRDGLRDARAGRVPYLLALFSGRGDRRELARSTLSATANLLLMGILLDLVFQWMILGIAYPVAALVVGPVLIATPYSLARALANRGRALRGD
jgi:hypothetical protein